MKSHRKGNDFEAMLGLLMSRPEFSDKRLGNITARILMSRKRKASRQTCSTLVGKLLGFSEAARDERIRRCALRSLLTLLPQSLGTMKRLLTDFSHPFCFEVHFSLINLLDPDFLAHSRRATAFRLLQLYLLQVPSERSSAAWLAGHKLGFHWDIRETYAFLLKSAKTGKNATGRKYAVYGLQEGAARAAPRLRKEILNALECISRTDGSAQVRWVAKSCLRT